MKKNKLVLDELVSFDFLLIGINASTEMYQLAYYINKKINISFKRAPQDIDFHYGNTVAMYQWYEYYSTELQSKVHFISNKSYSKEPHVHSTGNLFSENQKEQLRIRYLIPEFKSVDFFIKVEDATLDQINYKSLLFQLNSINQISTAYQIDIEQLKTPENLIFY